MKINTGLPAHDLNAVGAAAKAIEAQGFSGVSTQENRQMPFTLGGSGDEYDKPRAAHQYCHCLCAQSHGGGEYVVGYTARQQGAFYAGHW